MDSTDQLSLVHSILQQKKFEKVDAITNLYADATRIENDIDLMKQELGQIALEKLALLQQVENIIPIDPSPILRGVKGQRLIIKIANLDRLEICLHNDIEYSLPDEIDVNNEYVARSLASFLRGLGFFPPATKADLRELLEISIKYNLQELIKDIKTCIIENY